MTLLFFISYVSYLIILVIISEWGFDKLRRLWITDTMPTVILAFLICILAVVPPVLLIDVYNIL